MSYRSWSKVTTTLSSSLQEMDEVEVRTAPKQGERLTEAEVAETGSVTIISVTKNIFLVQKFFFLNFL